MSYVEPVFRPGPVEYNSYLLQVTIGCAHNQCTFCSFFKDKPFRIRPFAEIEEDLLMARESFNYDPPVFLLDGEPTCYSMDKLRPIFDRPVVVWTGGFMPRVGMIRGTFPKDKEKVLNTLAERKIVNRLLDQKIMMNGGL